MEKIKEFLGKMTKQQKIIAAVVAAVVVIACVVGIILAVGGGSQTGTESGIKTYTVEVKTEGGKAFEKLEVHVFEDNTLTDLVAVGRTDENGCYSFEAQASSKYVVVIKNVPDGYPVEEYYSFDDCVLSLALKAQLLSTDNLAELSLGLGDVMADLSVTVDGTTYTISELLKEKKAVVLNLWYEGCQPCKAEFPYINEAYAQYTEKLELLALNPYDGDEASVAAYKANLGLSFPMAKVDLQWQSVLGITAYPTTIVIDRYGTIAFVHMGSVPDTDTFTTLFEYFTSDSYVQSEIRNLDDIVVKEEGGDGSAGNPYQIIETEFDAQVAAGTENYYMAYKVNGMLLTINDADAYVIFNDTRYEAVDGKVSLILTTDDISLPATFVIGNAGSADKTFAATLSFVEGSQGNPYTMSLGDFSFHLEEGNDQGLYYTYTVTENGTLSLKCTSATAGVEYDFMLYNLNTYAVRNLSSDADGDGVVSILVDAGDVVQFNAGALMNSENKIPAADLTFNASFEAGAGTGIDKNAQVEYTVTVVSNKGKAVAGATVTISGEGIETQTLTTNESGVATISLPNGNFTAVVTAPSGYQADTTEYILTKQSNALQVTLVKTSTAQKTYSVTVLDESGKAISGASVTIGGSYSKTDANGKMSLTLEEDSYTASVVASGYESASKAFGSATDIKVTLKKETTTAKTVTYTVSVVTYKDKAIKNVNVQFKSGDAVVAEATTDSNGKASVTLKEGSYTAMVVDDKYGSARVALTAKSTSATVVAAENIEDNGTKTICDKVATVIKLGASYVELNASGDNYYVYTPTKAGQYEIKVTGSSTKVAYVGASEQYISAPSYGGNSFDINVTSGQVGHVICVFSVSKEANTVITIKRTGDAIEETVTPDYTGTCGTPSKFTLSTGGDKLEYFEATATKSVTVVKGDDGYYHYGSKTGPIVYINLESSSYISIKAVVNSQNFKSASLNEAYNSLMIKYTGSTDTMGNVLTASCLDSKYGIYPLNDDLMHMVKYGGDNMGWWDKSSANYLFGSEKVDSATAWLSLCCYVKE